MSHRPLNVIAAEIESAWKKPSPHAMPYLMAMRYLNKITDFYICDSGESIVLYFLSNARGWRGEDAKRIKAELKAMTQ